MEKKSYKSQLSEREQDLADRNEELEAQHEELNAAVEALIKKNEVLEKALDELNTRNKEIDQIVYRSFHDLKTPISNLEGLLTLMDADPTQLSDYIIKSKSTIDDMKYMLKMLRRYSNSLSEDLQLSTIDFEKVWQDVITELKLHRSIEGFNIFYKYPNEPVACDENRLSLIVYSLVKNSIDFCGSEPRIDVAFSIQNGMLKLQVIDNGIGIPGDQQSEVYSMFYRASNLSRGPGLGLYLCKKNVNIVGGTMKLVSSVGIGTTITIQIPLKNKGKINQSSLS